MVEPQNPLLSLRREPMKLTKLPLHLAIALLLPLVGAMTALAQFDQDRSQDPNLPTLAEQTQVAKPAALINKSLVGWQPASFSPEGRQIDDTLVANWVMLNPSDGIDGRVVGITIPIEVFLLRDGFVTGSTTTLADGSFQMESASPGPYTIVGYSPEAVFASGFLAVANDGEAVDMPIAIQLSPINGKENNKLIAKLIQEFAPEVNFRDYGVYDIGEGKDDPPQYYGWNGLRDLTEPAIPSNAIRNQPISLEPGGTFIGRVHQIHNRTGRPVEVRNTRIIVIQDGQIIAETQVDNAGIFEISNLTPGDYGVVGVGEDGLVAIGIELVPGVSRGIDFENINAFNPLDPDTSVIQASAVRRQAGGGGFDATMTAPESTGWLNNYITTQVYINAVNEPLADPSGQMPYNYFDQGGMYGDGGGGGGGGGDLLLPLGLGLLIYAAVDNNDNLGNPIFLSSPFLP